MLQSLKTAALGSALAMLLLAPAWGADSASPDDTARFLAGMQPSASSPLQALTKDGSWQQHARYFDSAWQSLDKRQLSKIRTWSASNLTERRPAMFYMFSGPDYLYADTFFPDATTYVLSGLEPVGRVPELTSLPRGSVYRELRDLQNSLNSVLNYSFFITKKMRQELNSGQVTGTLPILYVFLARSGKTVRDVSFLSLAADGSEHPLDEAGLPRGAARGVKIVFSGSSGREQTLYYFNTDLSDDGVANSGFLKFCEKLGAGDSLVKSASYLMYSDNFAQVRNFLLEHSAAIVQDDSGIPVHYFDQTKWELRPFGNYRGPISIFPGRYQAKLSEVFRKNHAASLDFGIGYRWHANDSNLLLAIKRDVKAAQP